MTSRRFGILGLMFSTLLALGGCAEESPGVSSAAAPPGVTPSGGASAACSAGATENCSCIDGAVGSHTCTAGTWTACACATATVTTTSTSAGDCKAGHYEGDFEGTYRSGFILGAGIPVYALDISFGPALTFTLEEKASSSDSEFPTYEISNGQIHGTADFVFPFDAKLTGTLDCRTKTLTGVMDGGYSIVLSLGVNDGKFKGPVTGQYDPSTSSFTGGTWTLHEEDSLGISVLGTTGGEGTWTAKWVSPP